jgi:hypothetical protein
MYKNYFFCFPIGETYVLQKVLSCKLNTAAFFNSNILRNPELTIICLPCEKEFILTLLRK